MFKKTLISSLVFSSFIFSPAFALTCAPTDAGIPFKQARVFVGGMTTCFYAQGSDSGWYTAAFGDSKIISGPWVNYGSSGYWCTDRDATQCVFDGSNAPHFPKHK